MTKTPEELAEDNMDADRNNLAGFLYEVYCDAVGGKAWDGTTLPTWHEFKSNMNKQSQVKGWLAVAEASIDRPFKGIINENT